jgi:hypothetical protein
MGGREAELIGGIDAFNPKETAEPLELLARLPATIADGACVIPSFVQGVGPYPNAAGRWTKQPEEAADQRAVTNLYLAMMANVSLDLIGSRDRLLIEGRFAEDLVFVRALASLRPKQSVYTSNAEHDVAYGALRLICPELAPATELTPVEPLEFDITDYATTWRELARQAQETS